MTIEVTEKDLDNITGFIKVFGICHFKDISGQQCLAHIRLMEGLIDLANRIVKSRPDNKSSVDIESSTEISLTPKVKKKK